MKNHLVVLALLLACLAAAVSPLGAAQDPYALLPKNTFVVVQATSLKELFDKWDKAAPKVGPPASQLPMKMSLGMLIGNQLYTGIDMNRPVVLAVAAAMVPPENPPFDPVEQFDDQPVEPKLVPKVDVVVLVPLSDVDEFREVIEDAPQKVMATRYFEDMVALSPRADLLESLGKSPIKKAPPAAGTLKVMLHLPTVLELAGEDFGFSKDGFKPEQPGDGGYLFGELFGRPMHNAWGQTESVSLGLDIVGDQVMLEYGATPRPDTELARMVAGAKPYVPTLPKLLPAGDMAQGTELHWLRHYLARVPAVVKKEVDHALGELPAPADRVGDDVIEARVLEQVVPMLESMAGCLSSLKEVATAQKMDMDGPGLTIWALGRTVRKDLRAGLRKSCRQLEALVRTVPEKERDGFNVSFQEAEFKVEGVEVDRLSVEFDLRGAPDQEQFFESVFGHRDAVVFYWGVVDDVVFMATGRGKREPVEQLVKNIRAGRGQLMDTGMMKPMEKVFAGGVHGWSVVDDHRYYRFLETAGKNMGQPTPGITAGLKHLPEGSATRTWIVDEKGRMCLKHRTELDQVKFLQTMIMGSMGQGGGAGFLLLPFMLMSM